MSSLQDKSRNSLLCGDCITSVRPVILSPSSVQQHIKTPSKKPFVVMTFVFFTVFPLVLMFCQSFQWLVLAFVLRGLKEFGEPTRKALIMDLAPEDCKAGMFGLYYLLRDVLVSVAAVGGAFLWQIGPSTNFLVAFSFGVFGTIGFAMFGSDLEEAEFHGDNVTGS